MEALTPARCQAGLFGRKNRDLFTLTPTLSLKGEGVVDRAFTYPCQPIKGERVSILIAVALGYRATGSSMWEARPGLWWIVWCAASYVLSVPSGAPVLWFTSNLGQLLELMSRRMRCPAVNVFEVGYSSNSNS